VGDQVYYETATLKGDFYKLIKLVTNEQDTTPGNATLWERIEIPKIFEKHLSRAIYCDWLTGDGQNEKRGFEEKTAQEILDAQVQVFFNQQQQRTPFVCRTR
jgi:hypothetical protein